MDPADSGRREATPGSTSGWGRDVWQEGGSLRLQASPRVLAEAGDLSPKLTKSPSRRRGSHLAGVSSSRAPLRRADLSSRSSSGGRGGPRLAAPVCGSHARRAGRAAMSPSVTHTSPPPTAVCRSSSKAAAAPATTSTRSPSAVTCVRQRRPGRAGRGCGREEGTASVGCRGEQGRVAVTARSCGISTMTGGPLVRWFSTVGVEETPTGSPVDTRASGPACSADRGPGRVS